MLSVAAKETKKKGHTTQMSDTPLMRLNQD